MNLTEKQYNNKMLELKLLVIKAKKVLLQLKRAQVTVKRKDINSVNWDKNEYWKNWGDY